MTDPTGRSFLSYRRSRRGEAALLIAAQHDLGIPTWQDVNNLDEVHTEEELRRVLRDPGTANAAVCILWRSGLPPSGARWPGSARSLPLRGLGARAIPLKTSAKRRFPAPLRTKGVE